jgi:hypothetical protein
MENEMRAALLALMTLTAISAIDVTPARAGDYPFCIKGKDFGSSIGDCSFTSYQQCQATASGRYAYCDVNPFFHAYAGVERYQRNKRRHRWD